MCRSTVSQLTTFFDFVVRKIEIERDFGVRLLELSQNFSNSRQVSVNPRVCVPETGSG
jgi:hypothetical protein